jgi:hypothetical protein
LFFDITSESLYSEVSKVSVVKSRVLLNIERFEIGQSYVTAKVQNRYGDNVTINIQGGHPGIELQETIFKIKRQQEGTREVDDRLYYAYLVTKLIQTNKIFVRKLPIIGMRDWLLIYEDTLVELSVKDAYDELEIIVV